MKTIENRFISTHGLTGWQQQRLQYSVVAEELIRLKNGVYATEEALADTMVDIDMIVPGGVLCLWSAWSVYGLTTQIPNAYYVAIERKRKVRLPNFPEFQLVYQSEELLGIGAVKMTISGYKVRIYDIERSVCDAIKYRNKIGMDVMSEILRNYLRRENRNLDKLMKYARSLRVAATLEKYLEAWQ